MEQAQQDRPGRPGPEEKAPLCSGLDGWRTKPLPAAGISSVFMADGPNGLRKESTDENGNTRAEKATCFPCACLMACCFDEDLMAELGRAIAAEAADKNVDLLLGPGVNIKRSPLCGRNFEYLSEDPLLAGRLAAGFIEGLQGAGVGATLKHYALNNQEKARLSGNSVADERAKREIYLAAFEQVLQKAPPWAVMTAYNKVDGTYSSENPDLLRILRQDWGYDGLVMSDWGGISDRVKALKAGLDLEMPGNDGFHDGLIVKALMQGRLEPRFVDEAARHVAQLAQKAEAARSQRPQAVADEARQHALARRFAAESMVLLKNDAGLLPLRPGQGPLAVVGAFARTPRYQGGGAANVHPTRLPSFLDELAAEGIEHVFAPGYQPEQDAPNEALAAQAVAAAQGAKAVVLFAGLPNSYESEGYDRPHMALPAAQNQLIAQVAAANPNTVVVLFAGGPVEMPWIADVGAVLMAYLPGQAGGGAAADLLFGRVSPSGRLPESFPLRWEDAPCHPCFGQEHNVEYRESIFVGYRYFGRQRPVLFPFGHGLSYSRFEYDGLAVTRQEDGAVGVSFTLANTGPLPAAEVAQLYLSPPKGPVARPQLELKAFKKVFLQPGQRQQVRFTLNSRDFSFYNVHIRDWQVLNGSHRLLVGASSRDIRLCGDLSMENSHPGAPLPDLRASAPEYYDLGRLQAVSDASFAQVLGHPVPVYAARPFTPGSTLKEVSATALGRRINALVRKVALGGNQAPPQEGQDLRVMLEAQADYLPLHSLVVYTRGGISCGMLEGLLLFMNKKRLKGIGRFFSAWRRNKKEG